MILAETPPVIVGQAGYLVIGFGLLVTWFVLYGVKYGYDYTLGAFLRELARMVGHIWVVGGALSSAFLAADHWMLDQIGQGIAATEQGITKWWHGLEAIIRYSYDGIVAFGHDVHGAIDGLIHGTVPAIVHGVTHPLSGRIGRLAAQLQAVEVRLENRLTHRAHALEATLERDFGLAWRGIDHIRGVTVPRLAAAIAAVAASIAALRRYAHRALSGRIGRLEKLLGAGVLSGIAIAALTRVFPWWKCTNVKAFNKAACRSPFRDWKQWLGFLDLAGLFALDAIVAGDLCDFIGALSGAAKRAQPLLLAFVSVENALLHCPNASFPEPLGLSAAPLPPRMAYSDLPVQ